MLFFNFKSLKNEQNSLLRNWISQCITMFTIFYYNIPIEFNFIIILMTKIFILPFVSDKSLQNY